MISKENFLRAFELMKDADDFYTDLSDVCSKYDVDYSFVDSGMDLKLQDVLIDVLMDGMNDIDEFIPWYLFDRPFGENDYEVTVKEGNTNVVYNLDTPGKLYNFLVKFYNQEE